MVVRFRRNLLELANTDSNSNYQKLCRAAELPVHPARFPAGFAEFFIKFLTLEGDMVYDPFAGSNTTGWVAESLRRQWIASELDENYVKGSAFRFKTEQQRVELEIEGVKGKQRGVVRDKATAGWPSIVPR